MGLSIKMDSCFLISAFKGSRYVPNLLSHHIADRHSLFPITTVTCNRPQPCSSCLNMLLISDEISVGNETNIQAPLPAYCHGTALNLNGTPLNDLLDLFITFIDYRLNSLLNSSLILSVSNSINSSSINAYASGMCNTAIFCSSRSL